MKVVSDIGEKNIEKLFKDIVDIINNSNIPPELFQDLEDMDEWSLNKDPQLFSEASKAIIPAISNQVLELITLVQKDREPTVGTMNKFQYEFFEDRQTVSLEIATVENDNNTTRSPVFLELIEDIKTLIQYEFGVNFAGIIKEFGIKQCYTSEIKAGIVLESNPKGFAKFSFWLSK